VSCSKKPVHFGGQPPHELLRLCRAFRFRRAKYEGRVGTIEEVVVTSYKVGLSDSMINIYMPSWIGQSAVEPRFSHSNLLVGRLGRHTRTSTRPMLTSNFQKVYWKQGYNESKKGSLLNSSGANHLPRQTQSEMKLCQSLGMIGC
jgi:hypothetical protein